MKPSPRSAAVNTALTKLGLDARGSVTLADARPDKAFDKAIFVEETIFLQAIQNNLELVVHFDTSRTPEQAEFNRIRA